MDLVNSICLDISFYNDRLNIIRKYLLPHILENKSFDNVNTKLLQDVFNCLNEEEINLLKTQIQEIVGEIHIDDFLETDWKIGICTACQKIKPVMKCKGEHHEECEFSEITEEEGCKKPFCDDCIYHICAANADNCECEAIRCESCSFN